MEIAELIQLADFVESEFQATDAGRTWVALALRSGSGAGILDRVTEAVVWNDDPKRREVLGSLIKNGAEAIGLVKVVDDGAKIGVDSIPLEHFRGNALAQRDLAQICRSVGNRLLKDVGERPGIRITRVAYAACPSGWLN